MAYKEGKQIGQEVRRASGFIGVVCVCGGGGLGYNLLIYQTEG